MGAEGRTEVDNRLREFTWNLGALEEVYGMQVSPLAPCSFACTQLCSSEG